MPSILNLRHSQTDAEFLVVLLDEIIRAHEAAIRQGSIISIDDGGVRLHALPVGHDPEG